MSNEHEAPPEILEANAQLHARRLEHDARERHAREMRRAINADVEHVNAALGPYDPNARAAFIERWSAVGESLRDKMLTNAEVEALDERRDEGMWPDRLHASGIVPELHDDDFPRIVRGACLPTRPLHIVRRWVMAHRRPDPARPPPSWVFLCGGTGVGKTVAAGCAIAQVGGVYTTMLGLLAEYQARSKRQNRDGDDPMPKRFERAGLVVLDELGSERDDQADMAREVIFRLVSRRQSRRRMTLVLTNDDAKALQQRFASGVYDLRTHSRLLPMAWFAGAGDESMRRALQPPEAAGHPPA